jgi:hypothetical protein
VFIEEGKKSAVNLTCEVTFNQGPIHRVEEGSAILMKIRKQVIFSEIFINYQFLCM